MGAKTEKWLRWALGAIIACVILWHGFAFDKRAAERKCDQALVTMQSFDVCYEKLPGCFIDFEDVHLVGKAIDFKKRECTE